MSLKIIKAQIEWVAYLASGQTILEVLVALALIILFLSGIVVVELYSVKNVKYAQNKSMAATLARQQLERARVVRDSVGIGVLEDYCKTSICYIDNELTPVRLMVTPTGTYSQWLIISEDNDACPVPTIAVTPAAQTYKITATVSWGVGAAVTPPPELSISSCITDWR